MARDSDSEEEEELISTENDLEGLLTDDAGGGFKKMYLAAFSAWMGSVSMGAVLGYSSPAIVSMHKPYSHLHLTTDEETWFGSIMAIGALVGGLLAGPTTEKIGRKTTLIVSAIPFVAGWLMMAYSHSLGPLLTGRIITGFCCGLISMSVPVYIAETSTPKVRGLLGSCIQLSVTVGVLLIYTVGMYIEWDYLTIFGTLFPVLFLILMCFMPESPRWLVQKQRRLEAIDAIRFLNGKRSNVEREYNEIEANILLQPTGRVSIREMLQPHLLKPLLLMLAIMMFQQWSGINGIMFYAASIFKNSGYDSIKPEQSSIILASAQVLGTLLGSLVMDRAGRRILLVVSGVIMAVSLMALSIMYILASKDASVLKNYGWLSVVSLTIYVVAFSVGYGPIPWLLMGEVLPVRVRGIAAGIATAFNWTNAFLVTKEFNDMMTGMNTYGTYMFFAVICALSCPFVLLLIPETKGKTLEEIERYFTIPTEIDAEPINRMG